jgi:trk system potassium uptake protein TrkA
MQRFVVVGLGNFGSSIAESLHALGHDVIAIDPSGEAVDRIAPHASRAAVGDGRDPAVLERLGAKEAQVGIVSTGDDITASILSTMALRDLGVADVYVKVISQTHARVMERVGVTETIFPERESALSLGQRLSGAALLNFVRLGPGFSVQEMAVPAAWNHKALRDLDLRREYGVGVVAVHDVLTDRLALPDPDTKLSESDTLLMAGRDEDLAKVARLQ